MAQIIKKNNLFTYTRFIFVTIDPLGSTFTCYLCFQLISGVKSSMTLHYDVIFRLRREAFRAPISPQQPLLVKLQYVFAHLAMTQVTGNVLNQVLRVVRTIFIRDCVRCFTYQ